MTLVAGGNVQKKPVTINPQAVKVFGWQWLNYRGKRGRRIHWWIREARRNGATFTNGTYHYNPLTGRLRAFNLHVTGTTDVIDALESITNEYA